MYDYFESMKEDVFMLGYKAEWDRFQKRYVVKRDVD